MIVLVGASASGKTELAKILFNSFGYEKCITTTTRLLRNNEKQDIDYHFISKATFMDLQAKNAFVEVTLYQDNFYGIQKRDVNVNGVVIVDPRGANSLIDKISNEVFVVFVESSENLRRFRMTLRGDDTLKIEQRLLSDSSIFKPEAISRINLFVKNESNTLIELANHIHETYQDYLKRY